MSKIIVRNTICTNLCDHTELKYSYSQYKYAFDIFTNKRKREKMIRIKLCMIDANNLS